MMQCIINKYGLLTKHEVNMAARYWPSFFCVFVDRDEVEVHKHTKIERAWSIKDLFYGIKHRIMINFPYGT